jgi:putative oxidoreductase
MVQAILAVQAYSGKKPRGPIFANVMIQMTESSSATPSPSKSIRAARVLSIVRIIASLVYISAGAMKLFGYPPGPMPMPTVHLMSEMGAAAIIELTGGTLMLLGLFTRPVAFILTIEMAVAYFQVHFPMSPWPTQSNGMPALLFALLWLYFAFAGGGTWSLDALIARRKREALARAQAP